MSHKNRRLFIRVLGRHELADLAVHEQVTRQAEYAAEFLRARDAAEDGDGAALREAAQYDTCGRDAFGDFLGDQAVEIGARAEDAGFVVGLGEFGEGSLLGEERGMLVARCCGVQGRRDGAEDTGRAGKRTDGIAWSYYI